MQLVALLVTSTIAVALLLRGGTRSGAFAAVACALFIAAGWWVWPSALASVVRFLPGPPELSEYSGSESCRGCHPAAYQSWHASFHRTMTQPAGPDSVLANFDGVTLESRGYAVKLERRGEALWAELPDPAWLIDQSDERLASAPIIRAQIVMTTGSHHLQAYWIRRPATGSVYRDRYDNGALIQLPFVWMIQEGRWIPNQDSFLTPPSATLEAPGIWNSGCSACHSVATELGVSGEEFSTRSVELGIACEACHGPADAHVARHRSPLRRYVAHLDGAPDESIVHPARLARDRSSELCAQCHSFSAILDEPGFFEHGLQYRPGTPLDEKRAILRFEDPPTSPHLLAKLEKNPFVLDFAYWRDGTIRVAGREHNGMERSACFERGTIDCIRCHSMHDYQSPSDQLAQADTDAVCLECHAGLASDVTAHTRHAPDSPGSRCVNCHMPHTTYGLFTAMRSHRIDNPSAVASMRSGRPNACNLCHLDRSLAWADAQLARDFGLPAASEALPEHPAAAEWALSGDAVQRVVTAWHLGWGPARESMQREMAPALLAVLLDDPYAAVRRAAGVSLRRVQPDLLEGEYDFLAPAPLRTQAMQRALERAELPIDAALFRELLRQRDDRPVIIIE